jgi:biopolymer transport protein ExbD
MQFHRAARKTDSEERILPLINVVFLLLIFFMLAGRLTESAPFRITPPESTEAAAPQAAPEESRQAVLLLAADGRLSLDGVLVEQAALRAEMAERLTGNPGLAVRLKADGAAEATAVVAVMELLRDAGVARLQLFTQSLQAQALQAQTLQDGVPGAEVRP